jgi:hypothetical protein
MNSSVKDDSDFQEGQVFGIFNDKKRKELHKNSFFTTKKEADLLPRIDQEDMVIRPE